MPKKRFSARRARYCAPQADNVALHSNAERLVNTDKVQPGLIAQQELDDATAKDRASQAHVDAAKSSLAAARQQLAVAQADQQHYAALSNYARIVAPYDGVVTWRFSDTGSLVQAGTSNTSGLPVVTVAQSRLASPAHSRARIAGSEGPCWRFGRCPRAGDGRTFHRQSDTLHRRAGSFDPNHAGRDRRSQSQLSSAARNVCRGDAAREQPGKCSDRPNRGHRTQWRQNHGPGPGQREPHAAPRSAGRRGKLQQRRDPKRTCSKAKR